MHGIAQRSSGTSSRRWPSLIGMASLTLLMTFACWRPSAAGNGSALTETLSWVPPSAYSDGTALPAADLGFYVVLLQSPCNAPQEYVVAPPATSVIVSGLGNGDYYATLMFVTSQMAHLPNTWSASQTIEFSVNGTLCPSGVTGFSIQ